MRLMRAYKERSEMLTQLVKQFTEKLAAHLSGLFLNLVGIYFTFLTSSHYIVEDDVGT